MINFLVRIATAKDSKDIFEWRNDKFTREMSNETKIINWEEHKNWFNKSLNSKKCILLICEESSFNKIALIRFDILNIGAVISINLNPIERGKNLSKQCLIKSIIFFSNSSPFTKELYAEVKENNIASNKLFVGVGFYKYKVYKNIVCYKKNLRTIDN